MQLEGLKKVQNFFFFKGLGIMGFIDKQVTSFVFCLNVVVFDEILLCWPLCLVLCK